MRLAIVVALLWLGVGSLPAQQAIATGDVNVRSGQSRSTSILGQLRTGDTVTLLSSTKTLGYYHVHQSGGLEGWAYARYLRVSSAPPAPPPGTPATVVDPTWTKPAPHSLVFHRAGKPDCGPVGQGGDSATNIRKNRIDEPTQYHTITFDAILALPYPKNHKPQRTTWTQPQLDTIAPYEGVAVTVTGFIAQQRGVIVEDAQNSSTGESTNCHATDDPSVDWHVTLVKHPNDPKSAGVVVETTPRVRANNHPWTPAMLAAAVTAGDSVRVSGWLMYDPEHFAETTNYDPAHPSTGNLVRATLWEVHPITKIEVFDASSKQWRLLP